MLPYTMTRATINVRNVDVMGPVTNRDTIITCSTTISKTLQKPNNFEAVLFFFPHLKLDFIN